MEVWYPGISPRVLRVDYGMQQGKMAPFSQEAAFCSDLSSCLSVVEILATYMPTRQKQVVYGSQPGHILENQLPDWVKRRSGSQGYLPAGLRPVWVCEKGCIFYTHIIMYLFLHWCLVSAAGLQDIQGWKVALSCLLFSYSAPCTWQAPFLREPLWNRMCIVVSFIHYWPDHQFKSLSSLTSFVNYAKYSFVTLRDSKYLSSPHHKHTRPYFYLFLKCSPCC